MSKKPSPLKHTEGEGSEGHLLLNKEAHKEVHGEEVVKDKDKDLPLLKDLTIYNTDNPKPPKSIEQKKEKKSRSTDLD